MFQRVPTPMPIGVSGTGTSCLPGTIIQPIGESNWKDLEQGTGVVNLNEALAQEHDTFKELCAGITPPLLPPPGLEFMAGLLPPCEEPSNKRSRTVRRRKRVTPLLLSDLMSPAFDQFARAQLEADERWRAWFKLLKTERPELRYLNCSLMSQFDMLEESIGPLPVFPRNETSNQQFTGTTDPLEQARAELRMLRMLMHTGRIRVVNGMMVMNQPNTSA